MSPFKGNRGMTPAPTDCEREIALAQRLLGGHEANALDPDKIEYLSSDTTPTEKEGRTALAKRLLAIAAKIGPNDDDAVILVQVALLFDPEVEIDEVHPNIQMGLAVPARTVDFRKISTGHPKTTGHLLIAWEVERLRASQGKQKAVEAVAAKFGMTDRRVYEICRKVGLMPDS
jgi:hypothetical protein